MSPKPDGWAFMGLSGLFHFVFNSLPSPPYFTGGRPLHQSVDIISLYSPVTASTLIGLPWVIVLCCPGVVHKQQLGQ